jgi:(R)-benzylsuccinyl-CoA dehydrogenase
VTTQELDNTFGAEEQNALRSVVREFVRTEMLPLERTVQDLEASRGLASTSVIPPDAYERLLDEARKRDLWGLDVPAEYGGQELGMVGKMIAVEELNRSIVPFRLPPESPNLWLLVNYCTDYQRERWVEPYARGELRASLALTEPEAGSDATAIRSTATRVDGGWKLNGTKQFISWADVANFFIVIAWTDKDKPASGGITAFIVDKQTPGLTVGRHMSTMGEPTPFEVLLDDCFVPDENVLGEVGAGFRPMAGRLDVRRIEMAARCVGMAERCIELMVEQAKNRKTFGQPLADRQIVQAWIADSEIDVHATRLMVTDAAARRDAGAPSVRREASMCKVFGTEMITRVVDRTLQLYGGMGFSKDLPIEYIYRNSRFLRVLEGASEIHRITLARLRLKAAP